jgi:hypothetical protein
MQAIASKFKKLYKNEQLAGGRE